MLTSKSSDSTQPTRPPGRMSKSVRSITKRASARSVRSRSSKRTGMASVRLCPCSSSVPTTRAEWADCRSMARETNVARGQRCTFKIRGERTRSVSSSEPAWAEFRSASTVSAAAAFRSPSRVTVALQRIHAHGVTPAHRPRHDHQPRALGVHAKIQRPLGLRRDRGCPYVLGPRGAAAAREQERQAEPAGHTLMASLRKSLPAILTLTQAGTLDAKAASRAGPSSDIFSTQKPLPPTASTTFS